MNTDEESPVMETRAMVGLSQMRQRGRPHGRREHFILIGASPCASVAISSASSLTRHLRSSVFIRAELLLLLFLAFLAAPIARGDAGVLVPINVQDPSPAMLTLNEMSVDIRIDNGDARVSVRQIFASHDSRVLEGNYVFALPGRAAISDFAVWDDVTRIPGVILERRRAEEIYESLRWQAIDPGLLQAGERDATEARRGAVFSARIVPIPAYGAKRIEIEYHETIPVEALQSFFALPLRPDAYRSLGAGRLTINFELRSAQPIAAFEQVSKTYPLKITAQNPNLVRASFDGQGVAFTEDFALRWTLDGARGDRLAVITHRDPAAPAVSPVDAPAPKSTQPEPGFFQASALLSLPAGQAPMPATPDVAQVPAAAPRTVVVLFDTSLSMQWEKLERIYLAADRLLHSLRPADAFSLILFNSTATPFAPAPVAAGGAEVNKAIEFVRASALRGGTNLEQALSAALAQSAAGKGEPYIVLLSDGDATKGVIASGRIASWFQNQRKQAPAGRRPRVYALAVGDDANARLMRMLARDNGVFEWLRSTEPPEFKLNAFLGKIGRRPVEGLRLDAAPAANFDMVYPVGEAPFSGAVASWVGQYRQPAAKADFTVAGKREGVAFRMQASAALPARQLDHPQLPRTWARLRVDALLEKIERDGEDQATIDEIIRLARKYKFVTPYTSFLAAPRSLLRPRVIRPGDPVLRVHTDPSIESVVALFPFGLIKPLRYLKEGDVWQTRFLAPADMNDGAYWVRLILRDRAGRVYRESKSFVIASNPPDVRIRLDTKRVRRGQVLAVRASASQMTRTVIARMTGVAPANLYWNSKAGANTGELLIPPTLPAGTYRLTVTAEDIAHNVGSQEVPVEVVP